ncbi:hypothetical protein MMC18_001119 [Xylographa bjoerkii]|nr:hypothetical protein [Xylographa bjoerkii]
MYEEWFKAREHEQYVEATEAAPFQAFLSRIISTEEATKQLILPGSASTKPETASRKLWRLWTLVFDAAQELPETHPILVDLVREFRERADAHLKYGSDTIDWTDAPKFDQNWRDTHDSLEAWRENSPEESQRWINFSAFSARVATANISDLDTIWGFFTIRDALEAEGQSPALLSMDVCASAQWILYAGKAIYQTKNSHVSEHWKIDKSQKTALWKGEPGFSRQRWAFWKERLHQVELSTSVSEETKTIVRKATKAMNAIEAGKAPHVV